MRQGCGRYLGQSEKLQGGQPLWQGTRMLKRSQSCVNLGEYCVRQREQQMQRIWGRNELGMCAWHSVNVGRVVGDGIREVRKNWQSCGSFSYHSSVPYYGPGLVGSILNETLQGKYHFPITWKLTWNIPKNRDYLEPEMGKWNPGPAKSSLSPQKGWGDLIHLRPVPFSTKNHPWNRWILYLSFSFCFPSFSVECWLSVNKWRCIYTVILHWFYIC